MSSNSIAIANLQNNDTPFRLKRMSSISRKQSTCDPSRRIRLSWHNLNVHVKPEKSALCFKRSDENQKLTQLLHDVSGEVNPGTLLAIMGSSGAGKTTLLNVLTNRNIRGLHIGGDVLVNGEAVGDDIHRLAAYVQQDDLFVGNLTVREHLTFYSQLNMDRKKSHEERIDRVNQVVLELQLSNCIDTRIGIPGVVKGISGGERKRLAFASEVLTNPALMFCDEPTSGLDSFMSHSIVSVLREMAISGGRTIIFTIHQPSSDTFELFDHLLLLTEGRVAFQGKASDALAFYKRAGLICPNNYNPADYFVNNLAIIPGREEECRVITSSLVSQHVNELLNTRNTLVNSLSTVSVTQHLDRSSNYKASWWKQFKSLLWRDWISTMRDRSLTKLRLIQTVGLSVIIGLVFLNQQMDEKGVMNINGAMFLVLLTTSIRNLVSVASSFCSERPLCFREHRNGLYRIDTYFLSKTLVEAPMTTGHCVLLASIVYWMIGFYQNFEQFFWFTLTLVMAVHSATSFGYFVSCIAPSANIANHVAATLAMPLQLFGGFYLNAGSVPGYLLWVKYISWFYYGNEVLMVNQWQNVKNITCDDMSSSCDKDGLHVLEKYNFHEGNFFLDLVFIFVLIIALRTLAYIVLLYRANRKT